MAHEYEERVISIMVCEKGASVFSETGTTITITDEAGGEFIEVVQHQEESPGTIRLTQEEWPTIRAAIDKMLRECRG
jgi:hypothetical protein